MSLTKTKQPFLALSKICLNNWHYIDQKILSFNDGINFFTGHSGSGKSTLINIILGNLQNYTGHVKYNNLELKEIDENSIVSQVAYISNSTHIYNDTLENNLTLWSQDITQNEIKKALKNVNLLDLQGRLKEKVSNDLLSEGQNKELVLQEPY